MQNRNQPYFIILALIVIIIIFNIMAIIYLSNSVFKKNPESEISETYNPVINPTNFSTAINNKYLTFVPKTKFIYEGRTKEDIEKIEVYVTEEVREVMGVKTIVVWDRVWLNGNLIEDTKDWYAQDTEGNVWYFGEESKEIFLGEIVSTEGSWEA